MELGPNKIRHSQKVMENLLGKLENQVKKLENLDEIENSGENLGKSWGKLKSKEGGVGHAGMF